jgi:imidazolonepropionase-like amidohydrolase
VGFHGTALGVSVHHELSIYVNHCGFSAIEALRSATSVTARRYNLDDRGRIMVGLIADLVLVRGNPTEIILDTLNITREGLEERSFYEGEQIGRP